MNKNVRKKLFAKKILIIDNDVLVNFVEFYNEYLIKIFAYLFLEFTYIFIPETILNEFLLKKDDKKREKMLKKIMQKFPNFEICPIKVSENEKSLLTKLDDGEADAYLQAKKMMSLNTYYFNEIFFLSADKKALNFFKAMDIPVLEYKKLIEKLKETGLF